MTGSSAAIQPNPSRLFDTANVMTYGCPEREGEKALAEARTAKRTVLVYFMVTI